MSFQIVDPIVLIAFWLSFSRVITIVFQLPLFEDVSVPVVVKTLTSLVITYAFFPMIQAEVIKDIYYIGVDHFWYLTIYNVLVGLMLGFFVKSIMQLFIAAGSIMTQQIGFSALRYFDQSSGTTIGPYEKLIQWTILILVISTGALLPMFKGVYTSFFTIHLYDLGKFARSPEYFIDFFKSVFVASILLSSPLIFTNILLNVVMGIISRVVPQMNVLMVSFVVNIGVGLLIFVSISDEFFQTAYKLYIEKLGEWFQFVA